MARYILKGTYTESGKTFFLDKEGYVVVNIQYLREHECYATVKGAKIAATRKTNEAAKLYNYEMAREQRRLEKGLKPLLVMEKCVYEPYELVD